MSQIEFNHVSFTFAIYVSLLQIQIRIAKCVTRMPSTSLVGDKND